MMQLVRDEMGCMGIVVVVGVWVREREVVVYRDAPESKR